MRRLSVCRSQTEFIMKLSKTFSTLSVQWNVRGGWCVFMDVWRRMACSFDPCHSLRPVLCLFSPWSPRPPPTPCPLTATNKRTSWVRRRRWRRWWGHLFYDFFAIFFLLPPFRFSGPFVPASSSGVGGHHLYRCLGIKAPWPLLLRGGLGQRWLGQGARGRGGLPFVPASRVGFSSHRPGSRRGGPGPRSMTAMR